MARIGVEVTTALRSGPSNPGVQSGRFHIAGLTAAGPVGKATIVRSLAQFISVYGDRTAYNSDVYDTARTFFEEGGSELVMSRTVGPAATKGTLTLKNATDVDTVKVSAVDPGTHSAQLSVEVTSAAPKFGVIVRRDGQILTQYRNLTTVAELLDRSASNPFVSFVSMLPADPSGTDLPAELVPTQLPAGTDDRASVTVELQIASLEAAGSIAEGGAVALPGYGADVAGALLAAHAGQRGKVAITSAGIGATIAEAEAMGVTLAAANYGESIGMFYPSLLVRDGAATRLVTPEGYVAAKRAVVHRDVGFWAVPAGDVSAPKWVLGTDVVIGLPENDKLADSLVNGIVTIGNKPRIYGWASMSDDRENMAMLTARDSLNSLTLLVRAALEPYVFGVLDGKRILLSQIESAVVGVADPIAKRNGFYAMIDGDEEIDPGYRVVVDDTLNTVATAADNVVYVNLAVRLAPTAQLIKAEIIKVPLAAAV